MLRTQRISQLLSDLEDCKADLADAVTAEQAECAREGIYACTHGLWLAGYRADEEVA